ncbi:hypothetical protein J2S62_002573 [Enteractinococcus fodinae]|uniref:Uncharacterized protein n=1 Tax=Enteractinococcus fodinae TaxID=684663 RepID=A0ABU2B4X1_9MICC|nr:hypothetical protein [Enteractinococcus fodinae]
MPQADVKLAALSEGYQSGPQFVLDSSCDRWFYEVEHFE